MGRQLASNPISKYVLEAPLYQRLLMASLFLVMRSVDSQSATLNDTADRAQTVCKQYNLTYPEYSNWASIAGELIEMGMLEVERDAPLTIRFGDNAQEEIWGALKEDKV